MKHSDALAIFNMYRRMRMIGMSGEDFDDIKKDFLAQAVESEGKPGNGVCICDVPPERVAANCERFGSKFEDALINMSLDHRCPHHGEAAQPALWGRHRGLTLIATAKQWLSLGIIHNETI